jgi:hypothetical protein
MMSLVCTGAQLVEAFARKFSQALPSLVLSVLSGALQLVAGQLGGGSEAASGRPELNPSFLPFPPIMALRLLSTHGASHARRRYVLSVIAWLLTCTCRRRRQTG